MKSYILAVVVTMLLSALFSFQNIGYVTVRFLFFEKTLPQGVWEVALFAAGGGIMWFFSLFSVYETRSKYKRQMKEKDEKIAALEQEKKSILDSLAVKAQGSSESAPAAEAQNVSAARPQEAQATERSETAAE